MKILPILFLALSCTSQVSFSHMSDDEIIQDKKHTKLCNAILQDFRQNARIGMSSKEIAEQIENSWIEEAYISPIVALAGWVPLNIGEEGTMSYYVLLYPSKDEWSNYAIYFRITDTKNWDEDGKKFLKGQLGNAVLKEYALCYSKSDEEHIIELYPKPKKR